VHNDYEDIASSDDDVISEAKFEIEFPSDPEELDAIRSDYEHAYERLAVRAEFEDRWQDLHVLEYQQANLDAHPESYRPGYFVPYEFDKIKLLPGFYGKEDERLKAKHYEVWDRASKTWKPATADIVAKYNANKSFQLMGTGTLKQTLEDLTYCDGLVGDIIDLVAGTARRPNRVLALGTAVAVIGTLLGRKVVGPSYSATHLYVVGLAATGHGKDHPLQCASRLLAAAGADQYIGPSQFMSMPSVTNLVARQAIVLCPIDEFGAFLARINSKRASGFEGQISGELRKLWSTSIGVYKTPEWAGRASETVYNPSMSILAASTPDEFYASLRAEDLTNGFLNRFLILTCNERPARGNPPKFKVPEEMAIRLRQLCEWRYHPVNVGSQDSNGNANVEHDVADWGSKSAEDTWLAFEEEMETAIEKDQRKQGFYQRCAEIAIRLATIRAAGKLPTDHEFKVGLSDVEWGIAVARTAADQAFAEAGDRMPEDLLSHGAAVTKVIDIIRKAGFKGISKSAILRKVQKSIKGKDLTAILQTLYDSKTIVFDEVAQERGGHPTQIYKMA
jgi:hypothetical protein